MASPPPDPQAQQQGSFLSRRAEVGGLQVTHSPRAQALLSPPSFEGLVP